MRQVTLLLARATVAAFFTPIAIPAPLLAFADSPKSSRPPTIVEEVPATRRWGEADLIPRITLLSAVKSFLAGTYGHYNAATNKFAKLAPRDTKLGIPVAGASSRRDAAERFLKMHHAEFGLSPDLIELRLNREMKAGDFTAFDYEQLYRGLPVFGGSAHVLAREDSLLSVSVTLIPILGDRPLSIPTDSTPAMEALIADVARRYPAPEDTRFPPKAQLGVLVRDGIPKCAWKIEYAAKDDCYRAYVDAESNTVLSVSSVRIYN